MTLISELKARNIWSTLAVYLGGGWVVIEAVNFLCEKYNWSNTVIDLVILAVVFGLPAVLIQTWFHGKTGKQDFKNKEFVLHGANVILFIAITIRILFFGAPSRVVEVDTERSIAVIPFKNLSADQENQFFADGVIEAVRNNLGKINELWVTSGNSTEQYRNSTKTSSEIANELGVAFMLSGSIQKYENHIRIIVELSDSQQDKQIWTRKFDREFSDLFQLQSDIALEIAQELNMKLSPEDSSLINKKYTDNLDAYVLYLEGQSLIRSEGRTFQDLEKAAEIFRQVIDIEENFSLAYVGLANTYLAHIIWGVSSPKEIIPLAMAPILRAMEIDGSSGETNQILGLLKFYQTDFVAAEEYLLKAISLNPNHVESYVWLANLNSFYGNFPEAQSLFEKAISLDPGAINYRFYKLSMYNYYSRNFDEGIEEIEGQPENIKNDNEMLWILAGFYYGKREYTKAVATYKKRTVGPTNWAMGHVYGVMGETDSARYILDYLLEKRKTQHVPGYMIACVYVGLGEHEKAIDWMEIAYDEDGPDVVFLTGIPHDPRVDPIRDNPRFIKLKEKLDSKK